MRSTYLNFCVFAITSYVNTFICDNYSHHRLYAISILPITLFHEFLAVICTADVLVGFSLTCRRGRRRYSAPVKINDSMYLSYLLMLRSRFEANGRKLPSWEGGVTAMVINCENPPLPLSRGESGGCATKNLPLKEGWDRGSPHSIEQSAGCCRRRARRQLAQQQGGGI